jgi:hypothetical protein
MQQPTCNSVLTCRKLFCMGVEHDLITFKGRKEAVGIREQDD